MHITHLYARGPYRVVELGVNGLPKPYGDTAGAWLHEDATLDGARAWLEHREAQGWGQAPIHAYRPGNV